MHGQMKHITQQIYVQDLRGLNTVNICFLNKTLSQCFSITISVTASILFVGNNIINTLPFAPNPSLIFAIDYKLQKQPSNWNYVVPHFLPYRVHF